uniref:Uncharacterized protein n=1 Tax=Acrobeloides nanus TaxID=290746 RepID=A0A914EKY1_9BILA
MKLLEVCEKICKNIYGGEYFPNWVAEEFDAKIKKKLVREQSFGREIREVKIGAYWALLFYNAISIFVTDNEKRAKVAYDTSKFLEYRYAISTPAHLRIDALKSIQKLGFPDTLDWDVINSIIKQFETIKLSKNFAVSEWFLKHLIREAETKKSLRRAIESIARDDGVPEEYEL